MQVEVLPPAPGVIVCGDRALMEVIKVKGGHKGGALIQKNWYPYKERKRHRYKTPKRSSKRKTEKKD